MRILEIVTVPFFTPRGTAFSALERTRALARLGHSVDILAYPLGDDVELPAVRIHRIPRVPGIRTIPMGPSLGKLLLDLLLALKTFWWLWFRGPWHLVHVHEEAAFWTAALRPLYRARLLYDMHSSLVEQLANFGYSDSGLLRRAFGYFERLALRRADAVIVICAELETCVRAAAPAVPVEVIENLPVGWDQPPPAADEVAALRERWGLAGRRLVLYTGTFGANQGLELAIDAMARVLPRLPDARLLLVGGTGVDFERVRAYAEPRGLGRTVLLAGAQPATRMPLFMAAADALLSPRVEGTNTPLKIYSYLAAGKPIVATALGAHTQVLSAATAELAPPTAGALADAIVRVLTDPARARALGEAGRRLAQSRYGPERYLRQVASILERAGAPVREAG
jgi:glycosyltransferase involved in cell wall biosynthesis